MRAAPLLFALACLAAVPARADSCDALTARVIRVTGASLAGRAEPGAVFRAADADRMSLDCRAPARIVIGSVERRPPVGWFTLVGLAAEALGRARLRDAQVAALNLHQDSLLAEAPMQARVGNVALRCETGERAVGLAGFVSLCVVERRDAHRRKGGVVRKAALPWTPAPG
ncbi:hypothetical protein [Methylobacterium gregans]|uniref:Uncharacterized protein n=1 Tax=Methylobacterium gregans TaxID=374424 RepID=A0AA37MA95_9HYPH|nr:hypothetical protein [Methylobacterium gregans]MDQ0520253.1 hypothetical protein [Methylobacterium gregans]GJD77643.1 hypothetical protein NBEOAGPD_0850 [Methylobacterium gregans]GLS52657.1 hypothetical protein GCM10007886_08400 [Methylobacterium gregans]